MSEDSYKNSKDKELFEFYLEHGYFPEDLNLNNKFQKKLKENLKNRNTKNINFNKNNVKNKNDYDKDNNYSE